MQIIKTVKSKPNQNSFTCYTRGNQQQKVQLIQIILSHFSLLIMNLEI